MAVTKPVKAKDKNEGVHKPAFTQSKSHQYSANRVSNSTPRFTWELYKRSDHAYGFGMGERKSRPLAVVIVFLCNDEVSFHPMTSVEMRPE